MTYPNYEPVSSLYLLDTIAKHPTYPCWFVVTGYSYWDATKMRYKRFAFPIDTMYVGGPSGVGLVCLPDFGKPNSFADIVCFFFFLWIGGRGGLC